MREGAEREGAAPPSAQSASTGRGSATRSSQFMIMEVAHSFGRSGLVGVRSTTR